MDKIDILAIGAHPDDVEFSCGGYLHKASSFGQKTAVIDLTRGEAANQGTPEIREAETKAASQILGISYRENLAFPDCYVGKNHSRIDRVEQLELLTNVIRKCQPKLLLIPYGDNRHPDHDEAMKLCEEAYFYSGVAKFAPMEGIDAYRPKHLLYFTMRKNTKPTFIVDISDSFEAKYKAFDCYASQIKRSNSTAQTLVSSPLMIHSAKSRDGYYGSMIGVYAGEGFISKTPISLSNPLQFFADQPSDKALFFQE